MTLPLVSIIIPTYNRAAYLLEAIDSALSQTYQHIEVVVVDDGSTDNTMDILDPIRGRITFLQQKKAGRSAARNTGIRQSSGSFIIFLDSDDLLLPDAVCLQVEYFVAHPEIDVIYGNGYTLNADATCGPLEPYVVPLASPGQVGTRMLIANVFALHAAMVRRDSLPAHFVFDESLHALEDWDLWLRMKFRGATFAYHDSKIAVYRRHSGNTDESAPTSLVRARALISAKVVRDALDRDMSEDERRLFRLEHLGALVRFGSPYLLLRTITDVLLPHRSLSGPGCAAFSTRILQLILRAVRIRLVAHMWHVTLQDHN
jgi:glycosyltransferase involved in cell wall biosynthesis